jgi:hypothetical protein
MASATPITAVPTGAILGVRQDVNVNIAASGTQKQ